ncbi:MAG: site-specific integrase [Verrucomicrobia bacterium]|nr:site-specific integrase [Verrucomicrobiota bacterium]
MSNTSEKAARQRADKIGAAMVKGQASRMALSHGAWQDVCVAREIIRKRGWSLTAVAHEWADCTERLPGGVCLLDATNFYLINHFGGGPPPQPTGLVEAADRYHEFKLNAGKSKGHCKNIRSQLDRLLKALPPGVRLDELTAGQLDAVVVGFGLKAKTMNEYRIMLSNLYSWAAKQNPPLVSKGFNPAKDMERHDVKHGAVESLRVADLRTILVAAQAKRPDFVPLIVLVCFGGLRPSEAVRLDWSEVGTDYIRLPGKKSKTGYNRQIPIQENLKAWLAQWRKKEGLVCPGIDLPHFNVVVRSISGVCLSHDGMRHGYGTHRQQIVKNVGMVADEMGHSMEICRRHYLNAFCAEEEAKEWFSVVPPTVPNIINLPSAAAEPSVVADAKAV